MPWSFKPAKRVTPKRIDTTVLEAEYAKLPLDELNTLYFAVKSAWEKKMLASLEQSLQHRENEPMGEE
jgi:hypothetical protein